MIRVGIVIIGNEVLSGKVSDENAPFLCRQLRKVGCCVARVAVIPDDADDIAQTVSSFASRFDRVITTGGIGPTHDDVTIAGIAKGFGVEILRNPGLEDVLRAHFKERINESLLKMADVPEGTQLLYEGDIPWPILLFRSVYIFPGVPKILRSRFLVIQERFRDAPINSHHVYLKVREDELAEPLATLDNRFPLVCVGSYPILDCQDYYVVVTLESRSAAALDEAMRALRELLPASAVHRVDLDPTTLEGGTQ